MNHGLLCALSIMKLNDTSTVLTVGVGVYLGWDGQRKCAWGGGNYWRGTLILLFCRFIKLVCAHFLTSPCGPRIFGTVRVNKPPNKGMKPGRMCGRAHKDPRASTQIVQPTHLSCRQT